MKIVAIVTSYNPDIKKLKENINSYLSWVDHLIIWENTPQEHSCLGELELVNDKIEILSTGKNEYLAIPFNKCIERAKEYDYDYILTMDQDSHFIGDSFGLYKDKVASFEDESVTIFAPATNCLLDKASTIHYIDSGSVYSSGSIYKRKMFDAIGGFREDLAIYCLDTEICMRARKYGYKIAMFSDICMEHTEGYKTKGIGGITVNNYSAQSTYFYVRNNLLLWKIYPADFTFIAKYNFFKYHVIYRIAKIVFEKNKFSKLKALLSGLIHGIKNEV
jgi:rhamnosyltransferase